MRNVLYFKFYDGGSEFYRLKPLEYIDSHELTLVQTSDSNQNFQLWDNFDTFILLRPQGEAGINLIKVAKRWHKKIIIDWDDIPTVLDQYNPMYSQYEEKKATTLRCVTMADEVWVATQAIKDAFKLYNKNIHVIPNAWDDYTFPVHKKREFNYNKVACYRAGDSHYGDIYDIGVPERIIDMVTNNPDWTFNFYGQRFHYLEKRTPENYVSYPGGWPMKEFQEMMQKTNGCIFFYPLATTPFNRGKSSCSLLEATYAGSSFFGNKDLPEFNHDFIIDFKELRDNLIGLSKTKGKESKLIQQILKQNHEDAWEYIKETLLVSKVNELRKERLLA